MRSRLNVALLSVPLALLLHSGSCRLLAADGDSAAARQQWMLGYLKFEQATAARSEQHLALARQLYGEALVLFQDVGRRYPEWNPELVGYRSADCSDQLRRLEEAVTAALDTMSRAELTAEVRRLREARQGLDAQAQSLAMKVEQLESSLQATVGENQKLRAEVTRLSAEWAAVRQRAADQQTRLDAVSSDLKAREADLARLQASAGDAAALKTSLADLGRQAAAAAAAQQEAAALRAQLADLEAQRRQDAARVEELTAQVDRRRREADAIRSEREGLLRSSRESKEQAGQTDQARRAALDDLQAVRDQLAEARRQVEAVSAQHAAAAAQAQAAEERAQASARDSATLKAEGLALREELRGLQAADVARLRQEHATALTEIKDLQAAAERARTESAAARAAEQRLLAEKEAAGRVAQEAVQAEARQRSEVQGLEVAAAKALEGGDTAAAEAALRRLLAARPQDALVAARLGTLLAERGDLQSAAPLLQAARRALPEDADVLSRLGMVLLRQGQPLPAAAALMQAAVAAPERASVHHLLGACLVDSGWRDAAEREFARAFELDGKRADTAYCLAVLLAAAAPPRRQEARTWYDRALVLGAARDAGLDSFFADPK